MCTDVDIQGVAEFHNNIAVFTSAFFLAVLYKLCELLFALSTVATISRPRSPISVNYRFTLLDKASTIGTRRSSTQSHQPTTTESSLAAGR